jgi:hypothetical protein
MLVNGFFGTPKSVNGDTSFLEDIILISRNSTGIFDSSVKFIDPENRANTLIGMYGG